MSRYGQQVGSSVRFIGVPKTIDNDLCLTDHTPGYGSAAKYIATILKEVIRDSSVYNIRSVTVAEIMGRHAGWLAGAACLAGGDDCEGPDLILLPEVPFDPDRFLTRVDELQRVKPNVIIAASEGVRQPTAPICAIWSPPPGSWMPLATRPSSAAPAGTFPISSTTT